MTLDFAILGCMTSRLYSLILSALVLVGVPVIGNEPSVVSRLDLNKYQGKWFEVARFPNPFQDTCQKNVSAQYRLLEDGFIEVINRCELSDGKINSVTGLAKWQSTDNTAKLGVSFFDIFGWRPIWGDYWVLDIDPAYQLAVVGDRQAKYGWVLSRTADISVEQLAHARAIFSQNGYDSDLLGMTDHD